MIFQLEIPVELVSVARVPRAMQPAADVPPPLAPSWYAPLEGLKLERGTRFVAGFAHEDQSLEDQVFVRDLIERIVGAPVMVSHACGLGRRSPEAAERALRRVADLTT